MESSSEVGCKVGCNVAILSFFNMCKRVVLPALSKPRNNNLACLFHKPKYANAS
jgi:hypothetical protein